MVRIRRYCLAALVLLSLIMPCVARAEVTKLPVIHIEAGSALEMGLDIGRKTKTLFPDIEQRYDKHLAGILSRSELETIVRIHLPALLDSIDKPYREQITGVAGAWALVNSSIPGDGELSLDEYRVINLLADLGFAPNGSAFSVLNYAAVDYRSIVGRNLDWQGSPELLSLQAITVYHSDERSVVNIGFAGLLSVLSGFNSDGLFVSVMNAAEYNPYQKKPHAHPRVNASGFDFRKLLETRTSVDKAARFLSGRKYGFDINVLLADRENVKTLEYPAAGFANLRAWDSPTHQEKRWKNKHQIATVDCFVLLASPDNCRAPRDIARWQQFDKLAVFKPTLLADMNNVSAIMFDTANHHYEIFNEQTIQSMVYKPHNSSLYLYAATQVGKHPKNPVHQVYLDILPPQEAGFSFNDIELKWLVWGLLSILLSLVGWQFRKRSS